MKTKAKTASHEGAPTTVNGKVPPPRRLPNAERRQREYLTGEEVGRLIDAARSRLGRHGHRDATMILLAYRHGLRASELVALRWDMIDYHQGYWIWSDGRFPSATRVPTLQGCAKGSVSR